MTRPGRSKKLGNVHPGEVLKEEFLVPMGVSQYRLAKDIGVPLTRIAEICRGRRSVTADTALRLSRYFGTTTHFWLGLQQDFDVEESLAARSAEIRKIQPCASPRRARRSG